MSTKIINLTPHPINILKDGKAILTIPASGTLARCVQEDTLQGDLNGIPFYATSYGNVSNSNIPEEKEGIFYVVSLIVAQAVKNRNDLLITVKPVRDEQGHIIGCEGLSQVK